MPSKRFDQRLANRFTPIAVTMTATPQPLAPSMTRPMHFAMPAGRLVIEALR
jgi:hypothetical protein